MAIWFQDDGCLKKEGNRIILSTESFAEKEIIFLRDLLQTKFRVTAQVDAQNRLDVSSMREVRKFQALVEPLIHPSMARKNNQHLWPAWQKEWRQTLNIAPKIFRTSIYLPYDFYQAIKGQGYSQLLNSLLDKWLDEQWQNHVFPYKRRYQWLWKNSNVNKGTYLITPRFQASIKTRLDILSTATGFEKSELVIMALREAAR